MMIKVHGVTGLLSAKFHAFSAVVSEICELNRKTKNLEIYSYHLSQPHYILCNNPFYLPYGHMITLTMLELRTPQT